jgi:transcriptional regulator with XRE-family HTH domain
MGKKIQAFRKSSGISVRELGELCGLDYSNLSRIENGQVDCQISTLRNIANKLCIDVKRFL